ncbi:Bacterial SH3 domain family [Gloeomargarita lithophora Alchichica-D10]|uniref:non-specific serine/threonine protein kinase n=1 Tax=Gloeomargarita lithophora Alchichica-D10 TaxID=1188229 RepID=A0A1J0A9B7_9CYAN|nr:protein kinase [Gloeomargarita lithophora]APB32524.1 Bacterial SH3 domain family [Gloeomargarita lithophora Alchichica-D10]
MPHPPPAVADPEPMYLHLRVNAQELWLGNLRPVALLGRNPASDLLVDNGYASRNHARIEYRHQHFYLRDESRNGTFVRLGNTLQVIHLRGEEMPLGEQGEISLGCQFDPEPRDVIHFQRTPHLPPNLAAQASLATTPGEDTVAPMAPQALAQVPPELNLTQVLESLVEGLLVILSPEGMVYYQNPTLARLLEKNLTEVLGRDFLEFVHPEDRQVFLDVYTQVLLQNPTPAPTLSGRLRHGNQVWQSCQFRVRRLPAVAGVTGLFLVGAAPNQAHPRQKRNELIGGRYLLQRSLATGGFCETYLGQDTQRPGEPRCVIKRLRLDNHDPKVLTTARRLFATEAATLERLGRHDQIPLLLAYLEQEEEFYIIQDFIAGQPLNQELGSQSVWDEMSVVWLLWELLIILDFVQQHKVIHRDIKPDNVIRRDADRKLVLIDFGAVKVLPSALSGQINPPAQKQLTIAVGTPGYMAPEQAWGQPNLTSDLYAVGVIAIEALTGQSPQILPKIPNTNELDWQGQVDCSPELTEILVRLLNVDWRKRFQSARLALKRLDTLFGPPPRHTDFL